MKTIIIRRESLLESIVCDIFTFCGLWLLSWFNYKFIGGSYFVNFFTFLFILVRILGANDSRVKSLKNISEIKIKEILNILNEEAIS